MKSSIMWVNGPMPPHHPVMKDSPENPEAFLAVITELSDIVPVNSFQFSNLDLSLHIVIN